MGTAGQEHLTSAQSPITEIFLSESATAKQALALKANDFTAREFIESRICPLLGPEFQGAASDCAAKIVQNTGTGRLTLRYVFGTEKVIFAKLYDDELGSHCYEVNRELWNSGFNSASRHCVPQPLGFLADHNLLLMGAVGELRLALRSTVTPLLI